MNEQKDHIRLRFGVCCNCRVRFWWTGETKSVPPCSCGRQHDRWDFNNTHSRELPRK